MNQTTSLFSGHFRPGRTIIPAFPAKRRSCVKKSLGRPAPDFSHGPTIPSLSPRFFETTAVLQAHRRGAPAVLFVCNGVLVDGDPTAAAAPAAGFPRAPIPLTPA